MLACAIRWGFWRPGELTFQATTPGGGVYHPPPSMVSQPPRRSLPSPPPWAVLVGLDPLPDPVAPRRPHRPSPWRPLEGPRRSPVFRGRGLERIRRREYMREYMRVRPRAKPQHQWKAVRQEKKKIPVLQTLGSTLKEENVQMKSDTILS